LIVKLRNTVESQPAAFVNVEVYVPLVVYVVPFADHVYESQAMALCKLDVAVLIVKFNVAIESHPAAFVSVAV